jgi:hypothetical protein
MNSHKFSPYFYIFIKIFNIFFSFSISSIFLIIYHLNNQVFSVFKVHNNITIRKKYTFGSVNYGDSIYIAAGKSATTLGGAKIITDGVKDMFNSLLDSPEGLTAVVAIFGVVAYMSVRR